MMPEFDKRFSCAFLPPQIMLGQPPSDFVPPESLNEVAKKATGVLLAQMEVGCAARRAAAFGMRGSHKSSFRLNYMHHDAIWIPRLLRRVGVLGVLTRSVCRVEQAAGRESPKILPGAFTMHRVLNCLPSYEALKVKVNTQRPIADITEDIKKAATPEETAPLYYEVRLAKHHPPPPCYLPAPLALTWWLCSVCRGPWRR